MTKATQIRMINQTLVALSLSEPTTVNLHALAFWQAALNRVAAK